MMKSLMKNQRGDTIVEVMIAVAVISLVLAASYAITTRNVGVTQDTQEHNQAQQIVQQQIERLRVLHETDPTKLNGAFTCIVGGGAALQPSVDPSACKFVASGKTGSCTEEPCYNIVITKDLANKVYIVEAKWNSLQGATSKTRMVYGI